MQQTENLQDGLQIKYSIGDCAYGKALFAGENIKKGTLVNVEKIGYNIKVIGGENELIAELEKITTAAEKKHYLEHTLAYGNNVYVSVTDEQYINHSENPNIGKITQTGPNADPNAILDYAITDIKKGDEIVEDYRNEYDHPDWLMRIIAKYGVDPEFY